MWFCPGLGTLDQLFIHSRASGSFPKHYVCFLDLKQGASELQSTGYVVAGSPLRTKL